MSSCRKKISEKALIANRFKQISKAAPIKRNDEETKLLEKTLDCCTENRTGILIVKVDSKNHIEMATNLAMKPRTADKLASILAGVIMRVASEVGISADLFIGKIVEKVGYFTEELLSGEMLKRMEEESNGKDDTGIAQARGLRQVH